MRALVILSAFGESVELSVSLWTFSESVSPQLVHGTSENLWAFKVSVACRAPWRSKYTFFFRKYFYHFVKWGFFRKIVGQIFYVLRVVTLGLLKPGPPTSEVISPALITKEM